MADVQLYTVQAAIAKATNIKTALAVSVLHFFKDTLILSQFTTKAEFEANECDFDGYVGAGYPLAAWTGPLIDPNGGAIITSPLVNIAYGPAGDPVVANQVAGWWVEDAAGNVRWSGTYDPVRPMGVVGNGWPWVGQIVEARNPVIV